MDPKCPWNWGGPDILTWLSSMTYHPYITHAWSWCSPFAYHCLSMSMKTWSCQYQIKAVPRGVHSLLYFAYTCVRDLFIGGLFTLQKKLQGMVFFKIKVNACILINPIINYNFLGKSFKNVLIYLYYIFFLIVQVYAKSFIQVVPTKITSFHPLAQTLSHTNYS